MTISESVGRAGNGSAMPADLGRAADRGEGGNPFGLPVEVWEERLEIAARSLLEEHAEAGRLERWVAQLKRSEHTMLRHLLELPASTSRPQKRDLLARSGDLPRFVLAKQFAYRKSAQAIRHVASRWLDPATLEMGCGEQGESSGPALVFALLEEAPDRLDEVLYFDRLHRSGFARMHLPSRPRRPPHRLGDFLASARLREVLAAFDESAGDNRPSLLQQVIDLDGGHLVFIRRPRERQHVIVNQRLVHGFAPDQIVLHFLDEAARVHIASHTQKCSFEIADRIASRFYGTTCRYVNVTEELYEAQLRLLLTTLRDDQSDELKLVEITLIGIPLRSAPELQLALPTGRSLGGAVMQIEQAFSWSIEDVRTVPAFKVSYGEKRVKMIIDRLEEPGREDLYVLRYRDQSLSLDERPAFEELFAREHGIRIVSTEKRGSRRQEE